VCTAVFGRVHWPCTLPFSAVYIARTWPCNGPCTRPLHGRVQGPSGPCIRQVGLPGRVHVPRWHATAVCGPLWHTVRVRDRVHGPCRRTCTRLCIGRVHDRVHGALPRPTAVTCRLGPCTRPCRPTCHVHDGPFTRPCTRPVYTNIYRAVYGPCTWPVYTAVYWPCTRLCIWRVHGFVTAVYTYACVHGCVHGRVRAVSSDRVDGRVRAVYRDAGRVHGSCAVCYYDFLCKRQLLCRNVHEQIHYIQKELGQLALLAPRCGGQQYYVQSYILKSEASVRLCAPRSERALNLYTQRQTALLRPIYPVSAVVGS